MTDGVRWLVERPRDGSPTAAQLRDPVEASGRAFALMDVTPRQPVDFPPYAGPTVLHGRRTLLHAALAHPRYRDGVFFDPVAFRPSRYRTEWGDRLLNATGMTLPIEEAIERNSREPSFVRPDDDDKGFSGRVFERGELAREADLPEVVDVAEPVEVDEEVRFVVVDAEVVAASRFRPGLGGVLDPAMRRLVEEATRAWSPAKVVVIDVARAQSRLGIVEANCFNGSRLYGCDVGAIVDAVSAVVARQSHR